MRCSKVHQLTWISITAIEEKPYCHSRHGLGGIHLNNAMAGSHLVPLAEKMEPDYGIRT